MNRVLTLAYADKALHGFGFAAKDCADTVQYINRGRGIRLDGRRGSQGAPNFLSGCKVNGCHGEGDAIPVAGPGEDPAP